MASRFTPQQVQIARIIAAQARAQGIRDPAALVAAAAEESNLNPRAYGDAGIGGSRGLFQLYAKGLGAGVPDAVAYSPAGNARIAARAWAQAGGRQASGPKAILQYYQRVGRGANNQLAYRRALPYYPLARQAIAGPSPVPAQPGAAASNSASAASAPVAASPPVAPQIDISRALAILNANARDTLAGRTPPQGRFNQLIRLIDVARASVPTAPQAPVTPSGVANPNPVAAVPVIGRALYGGVLGKRGNIIGTPYAGTHTLGNWESDDAVDIAVPVGTPVYAPKAGTIGSQFGSLGQGGRFAGLRLHLKIPGNELYYAHLSRFAPGIRPGVRVRPGQLLGYTGQANGVAHLHLGIRRGDPRKVLGL